MPGLPVHHQLPKCTQTHVHHISDAIQPSHPLLSLEVPRRKKKENNNAKFFSLLLVVSIFSSVCNLFACLAHSFSGLWRPFLHPPPRRDLFHDAVLQFPETMPLYSSTDAECNLCISLWILLWLPTIPDWTGPGSKVSDGAVPSSPGGEMEAQGKLSVKVFGF